MKKVLIVALTSRDSDKLARLIWSTKSQFPSSLIVEGLVVCNTTNPLYAKQASEVAHIMGWGFKVTQSNGRPGRGKNSALEIFSNTDGFDYLFLMDGDDFLYPSAFGQIEQLLRTGADVIGLLTNDIVESHILEGHQFLEILPNRYLYSWFDQQVRWPALEDLHGKLDITKPVGDQITPDRLVLFSKKAAEMLRCSEDLPVYEDYVLSLRARAAMMRGQLSYVQSGSTYTYVYDKTDDASVCKQFDKKHEGNWSAYDHIFRSDVEADWETLASGSPLDVPFVQINNPKDFNTSGKMQFLHYVLTVSGSV